MSQEVINMKPNSKKSHTLLFVSVLLVVIATALGAYMWRTNQANKQREQDQKTISQLQTQLDAIKQQSNTQAATTTTTAKASSVQPSLAVLDNIKAALSSKNTAALEGYMAPKVMVVYAASEAAGEKSPAEAVTALNYVNSGAVGPWDFNLSSTVIGKYSSGDYKTYFSPTTLVGRASNGFVVAVNFNGDGKINGIFVSASDTLL